MYPFSTQNERDYSNLLSVYLDAVFFPHLRRLDFLQEVRLLVSCCVWCWQRG
jgi:Zn-dependent M16 (insulinase) family peptidase